MIQGAQSGEFLRRVDELLQGKDGFYEAIFASLGLPAAAVAARWRVASGRRRPAAQPSDEMLRAVAAGMAIVSAYRRHGHLAANLDPLGTQPPGDPSLEPQTYGLTPALQSAIPACVLRIKVPGNTLAEILPRLRERTARRSRTKSSTSRTPSSASGCATTSNRAAATRAFAAAAVEFLQRLTKVETFERYVRKKFLGQKTFSSEGLDVMVPMLEEMLDMLADDGVGQRRARHGAPRPPQRHRARREPVRTKRS